MADIQVEFDNTEITAKLKEFIDEDMKKKLAEALLKACLEVESSAKLNCPVGDGVLRSSLSSQVDEESLEGCVGSNIEYAPYVEIGTGIYSSKGDGRKDGWVYRDEKSGNYYYTVGMRPRPFLQDAMESNRDTIIKDFEGII